MKTRFAGRNATVQEAIFVPPSGVDTANGEGYVMQLVDRHETGTTDLLILDAQRIDEPPVATLRIPIRMPGGLHGNWVTDEQLAQRAAAADEADPPTRRSSHDGRGRIAELEHRLGIVEDELAIRRLQHAYGYYLDKCYYDEVVDLFDEDGEVIFIGGVYKGTRRRRPAVHRAVQAPVRRRAQRAAVRAAARPPDAAGRHPRGPRPAAPPTPASAR